MFDKTRNYWQYETISEPYDKRIQVDTVFHIFCALACITCICAAFFGYGIVFTGAAAGFWGVGFMWKMWEESDIWECFIVGLLPISILYLLSIVFVNVAYFAANFLQPFLLAFILPLISLGSFHIIIKFKNVKENAKYQESWAGLEKEYLMKRKATTTYVHLATTTKKRNAEDKAAAAAKKAAINFRESMVRTGAAAKKAATTRKRNAEDKAAAAKKSAAAKKAAAKRSAAAKAKKIEEEWAEQGMKNLTAVEKFELLLEKSRNRGNNFSKK